jgi:hypothetical protein
MPEGSAELVAFARRLERARQERQRFIPAELFGEPGWSLMLDLFIAHHEGRVVNTSGACFGANVPQTTGLRWLEKLDAAGLIARHSHPQDTRFVMITLSPDGLERMTAVLETFQSRIANGHAYVSAQAAGTNPISQ